MGFTIVGYLLNVMFLGHYIEIDEACLVAIVKCV